MRGYSLFLTFIMIVLSWGCERKVDLNPHAVHWDRDMCARCKMVVSDREYAVQTTDPKRGKTYYFDDIGCLVLWFDEEKIPWRKSAKIWVTDVKTGKWIDARTAEWSTIAVTPMAFGYAAHKRGTAPKTEEIITYEEMAKRVIALEAKKREGH
jgi:hypothetical protein